MLNITQDFIPQGRGNRPGKSNPMLYITIHNTDNPDAGANAKAHAAYLKSDAAVAGSVSWHYTVDDGSIYQHLPDNENAWHCGDGASGPGNCTSIGIEICMNSDGNYMQAEQNAAEPAAYLMKQHNISIERVVQHNHWSGKDCPKVIRARQNGWNEFMAKVQMACAADIPWYNDAQWWVKQNGISDGTRPDDAVTRAEVWTMLYRFSHMK